ncbi:unnamed protein product [Soboliphyme baturini]|uniref:Sodium-and chloride-dependent glycine transporter 2 n=1 Tax=Soboliphyme baturini TaxID=241478 RepID=A0A183I971_9BILA|nr:unnamed protein product [Soboliphyme baturini]
MVLFVGLPVILMGISIGQFSSLGCVTVWKMCPLFKGIGIAVLIFLCFMAIYYNVVIGWSVHFLISSMRSQLPWSSCGNAWNTENCVVLSRCSSNYTNGSPHAVTGTETMCFDTRHAANVSINMSTWPSDEYFHAEVLELLEDVEHLGQMHWQLALFILAAWLALFFCLFNGIKSSGKVAYVTTIVPHIILFVLAVKVFTEDGGIEGVLYILKPRWEYLSHEKAVMSENVQDVYRWTKLSKRLIRSFLKGCAVGLKIE